MIEMIGFYILTLNSFGEIGLQINTLINTLSLGANV